MFGGIGPLGVDSRTTLRHKKRDRRMKSSGASRVEGGKALLAFRITLWMERWKATDGTDARSFTAHTQGASGSVRQAYTHRRLEKTASPHTDGGND